MDYDGGNKATMMEDMQNIRTPKNISHDVDRHNNKQLKELSNQWYEEVQKWKLSEQKNWKYTEHSSKANHLSEYHQHRKQ